MDEKTRERTFISALNKENLNDFEKWYTGK